METEQQPAAEPPQDSPDLAQASEEIVDTVDIDSESSTALPESDEAPTVLQWQAPAWEEVLAQAEISSDMSVVEVDAAGVPEVEPVAEAEPPPPGPIRVVPQNEKWPASSSCRAYWRAAGFECRAVIEHGRVSVTCKGPGGSQRSKPMELLLVRKFVSQGEAIAFMMNCLSFDPNDAADHGFEIVGRTILPT